MDSNHQVLLVVAGLAVGMNFASSTLALAAPGPALASFAGPERKTEIVFASEAGEFHEWIIFDKF